ncbi:keratin-associated protein 24-1 [Molossus nigricans]
MRCRLSRREPDVGRRRPPGRYKKWPHLAVPAVLAELSMHSGSVCLWGVPGDSAGPPCRTHCYLPVTPGAFCSGDASPAFGLCLPSSCQGSFWLLGNCQGSYGDTLSGEPRTRSTGSAPRNPLAPGNSRAAGTARRASEPPSRGPHTTPTGHGSHCHAPSRCPSATCRIRSYGPPCLGRLSPSSERFRPLSPCRLGNVGYRSVQSAGSIPAAFWLPHCVPSSCWPQNYVMRNCRYPRFRPSSCQPLSYFPRPWGALSCLPSTFPPLRYLCSGCRPVGCYR